MSVRDDVLNDLLELCAWTAPRRLNTKQGVRWLMTTEPNEEFWDAWRRNKSKLKEHGIQVRKDDDDEWEVNFWCPRDPDDLMEEVEPSLPTTAPEPIAETDPDARLDTSRPVPTPAGLELLDFQREGVWRLSNRPRALLADEMGLGKTVQTLAAVNCYGSDIRRVLVVCPKTLKSVWTHEAEKWLLDDGMKANIRAIAAGKRKDPLQPLDTELTVINYDILAKHREFLHAKRWDLLVCDEAHYLKTMSAKRTREVISGAKPLYRNADRFWCLTGTPVMSRPAELFPMLTAMLPKEFSRDDWFDYTRRYCNGHYVQLRDREVWDTRGATNIDELHGILTRGGMIRRLKRDVLKQLPDKRVAIVQFDPDSPNSKRVRKAERKAYIDYFVEHGGRAEPLGAVAMARRAGALEKTSEVVNYACDKLDGGAGKLVIFAHHRDVISALMREFERQERKAVKLWGDMPDAERAEAIRQFQTDDLTEIFIGQTHAAGVGITLTAANQVLFAELDWTPSVMEQAEDRCHRIGQDNAVNVEMLVVPESIDEALANALGRKRKVVHNIMEGNDDLDDLDIKAMVGDFAAQRFRADLPVSDLDRATDLAF